MLTGHSPPSERAEAAHEMRAAMHRIMRDLKRLPSAVRKVRAVLPAPQEPMSLEHLMTSQQQAMKHARRAEAELASDQQDGTITAIPDVHELIEEVRSGLASKSILDDIAEMFAEAAGHPDQRALGTLEARLHGIAAEADRLFALAVAAPHDLSTGAIPMTDNANPGEHPSQASQATAQAVREVGEIIAATLAGSGSATAPARPADRRFAAVADQMIASLQTYGMPYDGIGLPSTDDPDSVRAQLVEGLQRNFSSREEDGTRVYFRSAPQPVMHDADTDARLLRGSALVNANLLRAEADGVLAIIDRLPDMLRFAPLQSRSLADARARLRGLLDQLVATASDPLGINAHRGRFQFERISVAMLEVLRNGEIISPAISNPMPSLGSDATVTCLWQSLAQGEGNLIEQVRSNPSLVRTEELVSELGELATLMSRMYDRVATVPSARRGVLAGRLEELLIAVDGAAAALESELARFGSTPAEQEVQFFGSAAKADDDVSLAQFISWIRALCAPYVGVANTAASLPTEELRILADELNQVGAYAATFARAKPVAFGGVSRQFGELKSFIDKAAGWAGDLAR